MAGAAARAPKQTREDKEKATREAAAGKRDGRQGRSFIGERGPKEQAAEVARPQAEPIDWDAWLASGNAQPSAAAIAAVAAALGAEAAGVAAAEAAAEAEAAAAEMAAAEAAAAQAEAAEAAAAIAAVAAAVGAEAAEAATAEAAAAAAAAAAVVAEAHRSRAGRAGRGGRGGRGSGAVSKAASTASSEAAAARDENSTCIVCMDAPRTHIFVPCGHHCACLDCGNAIMATANESCPLCRHPVAMLMPVFTS